MSNNRGEGYSRLWGWFSLSYASWLTLPRVFMHEMPDEWQGDMARLLDEFHETFPEMPFDENRVQLMSEGRLVKTPPSLINYRYPDAEMIEAARQARAAE